MKNNLKNTFHAVFKVFVICLISMLSHSVKAEEIPDSKELFQGAGIEENTVTYSNEANESIDPSTGQLVRVYTDLQLPGNGGLDLKIQRAYYSKLLRWQISFGRIKRIDNLVTLELPDGSVHYGFKENSNSTEYYLTKSFWKIYFPQSPSAEDLPYLQTSDGTKYTFGANPNNFNEGWYSTTAIEKNGSIISISYQSDSYLTGGSTRKMLIDYVVDSVGRRIDFEYQKIGTTTRPVKFYYCPDFSSSCNEERQITTEYLYYDDLGALNPVLLKEVRPPIGPSWHYKYERVGTANRLQTVISPNGGVSKYSYDIIRRYITSFDYRSFLVVSEKAVSGRGVKNGTYGFTYSENPEGDDYDHTTVTDPTGRTTIYKYFGYGKNYPASNSMNDDECWQFGLIQEILVKSATDQLESKVETRWETSPLKQFSEPKHKIYYLCSDTVTHVPRIKRKSILRDGKTHVIKYESYDQYNNPLTYYEESSINQSSTKREFTIDGYYENPLRNIVQGLPNKITLTSPNFNGTKTTEYQYNDYGQVKEINANEVITKRDYYPNGNLHWEEDGEENRTVLVWDNGNISDIEDALAQHISHTINPDGTVGSTRSKRGYTTEYKYDILGRLTKIIPPSSPDHSSSATTISYPVENVQIDEKQYQVNSGKLSRRLDTFSRTDIDGFGRETKTTNNLGISTSTVYKSNGIKDYTDSSIGNKTTFDNFGRPLVIQHKDGTSISYKYDNGNILITDEDNNNTLQSYIAFSDPDDRLLDSVLDPKDNLTSYQYNIAGQLLKVVFNNKVVAHYGYDTRYFIESETHPETGTVLYTKDDAGNLTSITDSLGTRTYVYDKLNRLDKITYGPKQMDYDYDADDNITYIANETVQSTIQYDPANRLTIKSDTVSNSTYNTAYKYNALDSVRQITYPSAREVTYIHNKHNQVVAIPGFVNDVNYETEGVNTGLLKSIQMKNGIIQDYEYNSRRLITTLDTWNSKTAKYIVDRTHGYSNDNRGNLTSITDNANTAVTRSFAYDELNRIKDFTGPWGSGSYRYTSNGNRSSKHIGSLAETYQYNEDKNRLASTTGSNGSFTFQYNDDGDVTRITRNSTAVATLDYDMFHNLTSYSQRDLTVSFGYDAEGQRATKKNERSGKTTLYHSDQFGNTLTEQSDSGELLADYIYLNDQLLAKVADSNTIPDSDFDGMPDSWEARLGLDTTTDDSLEDPDGDSVTNIDEYLNGTNPVPMCGDITDDSYVQLNDLIQVLQILSGDSIVPNLTGDCNNDNRIGVEEVFPILDAKRGN